MTSKILKLWIANTEQNEECNLGGFLARKAGLERATHQADSQRPGKGDTAHTDLSHRMLLCFF